MIRLSEIWSGMKKYRKCDEIVEILKAMVRERIRHSSYFLPGEVAMAEEIGVSRITLRKALAVLEQEGTIRRDRVRTEIVEKRDILSNCGKILFVASVRYSTFILPAMERLWMCFAPELISRGGNVELFPVNHTTSAAEWKERISSADVIFLTTQDSSSPEVAELLRKAAGEKVIFSLMETISAPNFIYLDNHAVGAMAAQTLIEAGCRKIAGMSFDYEYCHNLMFARRMQGFRETLEKNGMFHLELIKLIPTTNDARFDPEIGDKYSKTARSAIEQLYAAGCDGVFLTSDEEIGLITMNLFRQKVIPTQMKLLSFNGVGDAMRNHPPISCLSHGTHKVVEAAVEQLKRIAEKRFAGPVEILVHPKLYVNFTLNSMPHFALESKPVSAVIG